MGHKVFVAQSTKASIGVLELDLNERFDDSNVIISFACSVSKKNPRNAWSSRAEGTLTVLVEAFG
jgi:hypothetical protein